MGFKVFIHHKAKRKLSKCEKELKEMLDGVFGLLADPFKLDTIRIKGKKGVYRTRIGKYRVLFKIKEGGADIMDFGTRGKGYKQW